ncbi:MAG: RodZ domain-containing protein, partial [Acidimicrobiales bacterium]
DPGDALVFDDARPRDRHQPDSTTGAPRLPLDRAQRHALHAMNHRPRRGLAMTALAVVAVVLFGVLAVVGSRHPPAKRTTGAVTPSVKHTSAPTVPPPAGSGHRTKTTETTVPAQLAALSSTSSTAVYQVASASFRLTISTSGPCWVNATSVSTGSTLWTGTMQSGGVQEIQATGATRVELGTLAVALKVDGVPVSIPASIQSPFVLSFEPGAAAPGGPTPSSTSTTATTFG